LGGNSRFMQKTGGRNLIEDVNEGKSKMKEPINLSNNKKNLNEERDILMLIKRK